MRYARRMNGYSEVPHNGEINNYLRKDLDAKATAKNTACWNLLGKVRTKRTLCFSLYTALELCGVELPRHSRLPQKDFYVTVRSKGTRSSLDNVDYRIWNAKFNSIAFSNGVTCMHPMDAWIQFAQYLNLTELVVLAEALIRRYGYAIEQFTQRLSAFHRVIGRARCEAALKLNAGSEVNDALTAYQTSQGKKLLLDKQVASLQTALRSTSLLMEHGNTTYLEVLTARQTLLSAQLSQTANHFTEIQSLINLFQALGGGQN